MQSRAVIRSYGDLLHILVHMTLWITAKGFALSINGSTLPQGTVGDLEKALNGGMPRWLTVERRYNTIKKLSRLLNNLTGTRVALGLLRVAFFYSVSFEKIADVVKFCFLMAYAFTAVEMLVLAADACSQVCSLAQEKSVCSCIFGQNLINFAYLDEQIK